MLAHDVLAPRTGARRWALVLHGLGDSKEGWKGVAPMLGLDGWGFIFAQAPDPYYGGWSWFDMLLPDTRPDPAGVARSRAAIVELIAHLESSRGIAAGDLALVGFSQGCLMALDVALRHERAFAAVVAISGWVHELAGYPAAFGAAARTQRILMTHGLHDGVIPIALTRPQAAQLRGLGLDLTWREYGKDHGLDPEEELADIRAFLTAPPLRPGGRASSSAPLQERP